MSDGLTAGVVLLAVALSVGAVWLWRRAAPPSPAPTGPHVRVFGVYSPVLTWLRYGLPRPRPRLRWPRLALAAELQREAALLLRQTAADELRLIRLAGVLACLGLVLWIGYAYALSIMVAGWQLWTWLAAVALALALLMPAAWPRVRLTRREWAALAGLFVAALALRALWLASIPGLLHVDEAGVADFALRHVYYTREIINPFRSGLESHPALYHILLRLSMAVGGISITGLRLFSAVAGAAGVLAVFAVVTVFHNRPTAWWAAGLMAVYHYHIHWSRLGLNNIWDTLWVPGMLAAAAWGWQRRWSGGAVLSGLMLGLSQYFYPGSRLGAMLLALYLLRLLRHESERRRWLAYTAKLALMAAVLVAPLAMFALRDPVAFTNRAWIIFGWKPEVVATVLGPGATYWQYFWHQLSRSLGAFTVFPDVTGFYGPGVPLLFGVAAILFLFGLVWTVRMRQWLPLAWIGLTVFFGGFLLSGNPSSSHYIVSIPAICWLVALPLGWLTRHGRWRHAAALGALIVATDLVFYFGVYVPSGPGDLDVAFPAWPPPP